MVSYVILGFLQRKAVSTEGRVRGASSELRSPPRYTSRCLWLSAFLLLSSLPVMGGDLPAGEAEIRLAGSYFSDDNSKLVLEQDGSFSWLLIQAGQKHYLQGYWTLKNERVHLLSDKPGKNRRLFEVATIRPWDDDAKKRLSRSQRLQSRLQAYEICPFLKTHEQVGLDVAMRLAFAGADAQGRSESQAQDAEQLSRYASGVEEAKRTAEQAVTTAMETLVNDRGTVASRGTDTARMAVADRAIGEYWQRYLSASLAYIAASSRSELPLLQFDQMPCTATQYDAGVAEADTGYAVVVSETLSGGWWQTLPMRVEFMFADGRQEQRDIGEDGWALVPGRSSSHLARVGLYPFDQDFPPAVLDVATSQAAVVEIHMDSSAVVQPPLEEVTFMLEDGDLVSPGHDWRYSCLVNCPRQRDDDERE